MTNQTTYKYAVSVLNGFSFTCISPLDFRSFLNGIRADGYLVTETVYIPYASIGHIMRVIEQSVPGDQNVVSLRPTEGV